MKHLSPPSPEVRALLKMMGIAAVIVIAQGMMLLLNQYFTVEDIMTGICACIIAGTFYVIFTMFVEQERRKDQSQGSQ